MPAVGPELQPLLADAEGLAARLGEAGDGQARRASTRPWDSVVRPLRQAAQIPGGAGTPTANSKHKKGKGRTGQSAHASAASCGDELWELARAATALRARSPGLPELAEATAALQDLAIGAAGPGAAESRLAELGALQAGLDPGIRVMADGPYLVTGAHTLVDWLGQPVSVRPQLALCRCGGSKIKPLCDGSHAAIGFTGAKTPAGSLTGATPTPASR